MMEALVLKLLLNKERWLKYREFIDAPKSLSKLSVTLLGGIDKQHKLRPSDSDLDESSFGAYMLFLGVCDDAELRSMMEAMGKIVISPDDERTVFHGLVKKDYANRVAKEALVLVDGGTADMDKIEGIVEAYKSITGKVDRVDSYFIEDKLDTLMKKATGGLNWRLDYLKEAVGPLSKGDFVAVGAYVGSGKTTFLASEVSFMAAQIKPEQKVLWVNLEERGQKVKRRIMQSALGWTNAQMFRDPKVTMKAYLDLYDGQDPIRLLDKADCSTKDIELALRRTEYGLIVIDMVSKLHGFFNEGNEVTRQGLLFNWTREQAKRYAPVITVGQLEGSAEGEKWPTMKSLYGSRVAMQAELDALIMIGQDLTKPDERYIGIVKNKMEDIHEPYRLGKFDVLFKPEIARYEVPSATAMSVSSVST